MVQKIQDKCVELQGKKCHGNVTEYGMMTDTRGYL